MKSFQVWVVLTFVLSSCVTVNVNFPEGVIQEATDDYVKELYELKTQDEVNNDQKKKSSFLQSFYFNFIPSAHATGRTSFNLQSLKIREIQSRQKSRIRKIDDYKKKGWIGEGESGLLVLRTQDLQKKTLLLRQVKKIVEKENKDRKELYEEVSELNQLQPHQASAISEHFSHSFQQLSPQGTWIQTRGTWSQK
ncbi:MAG: hypothetical protein CL678_02790 [Bdellovibrionaceae bacterium]|nr:hypothetical protein [Pseudobdellovibrionaceae bacterium]|tara:strand:+ start:8393 stop:8974 length:582 start_codon:yes stop_codon:yes gene_type:complete